ICDRSTSIPLVLSSALHFVMLAIFVAVLVLTPRAEMLGVDARAAEPMHLVFLATPGPGGGGGGGGAMRKAPAPKALSRGRSRIDSPIPKREPPKPVLAPPKPPEPTRPPLDAEKLPVVVAPIVVAPADARNRPGVL